MVDIKPFFQNEFIFVYFISFVILLTLIFDLLSRKIFPNKMVSMVIALIITSYVFITNGYVIINKILSLGTWGMIALFAIGIILIIVVRFWRGFRWNLTFS